MSCVDVIFLLLLTIATPVHGQATDYVPIRGARLHISVLDVIVESVKIFIYPAPPHVDLDLGFRLPKTKLHFHLETNLIFYLQNYSGQAGFPQVVDNPEEADFFWVPHALQHHFPNNGYAADVLFPFLNHIYYDLPYFNRSGGADHIFIYLWDNGPLCDHRFFDTRWHAHPTFIRVVHPMIVVGYHGCQGTVAPNATRSALRSECFWVGHDIAIPQGNLFRVVEAQFSLKLLRELATGTARNFQYYGTFGSGRHCSPKIRFYAYWFMAMHSTWNKVNPCKPQKTTWNSDGLYWLAPAGVGCWSARFYDILANAKVPVILADHIVEPFEKFFNYRRFTAKALTGTEISSIEGLNKVNEMNKAAPDDIQRLKQIRLPMLEALHDTASSFRFACAGCGYSNDTAEEAQACLQHPYSRRLEGVLTYRPWLTWNITAPRNALKMLMLELYCRTPRGRAKRVCKYDLQKPHATIAMEEYGTE